MFYIIELAEPGDYDYDPEMALVSIFGDLPSEEKILKLATKVFPKRFSNLINARRYIIHLIPILESDQMKNDVCGSVEGKEYVIFYPAKDPHGSGTEPIMRIDVREFLEEKFQEFLADTKEGK